MDRNSREIYAVRCTEHLEDGLDGIAGYFDNEKEAEKLACWINENSLSCDFYVRVQKIVLGKLDKNFISWVIS